ncbi:MAG: hypothetical protein ACUVS5_11545 [Anaerolineae bacterium]
MAYSLSQAVAELKRSILWDSEDVVLQELIGLSDGTNRVFRTQSAPVSNLSLYNRDGTPYTGAYTLYASSGTIVFQVAPGAGQAPLASYSAVEFTDAELLDIARAGFDEMEALLGRHWYLVDSGGETYISARRDEVEDPVVNGRPFSEDRAQVGLYLLCCLLRLVQAKRLHAASVGYLYRESSTGGVTVDRRGQAREFAEMERDLRRAIEDNVAALETLGAYIPGAKSDQYLDNFEWWTGSRQSTGAVD